MPIQLSGINDLSEITEPDNEVVRVESVERAGGEREGAARIEELEECLKILCEEFDAYTWEGEKASRCFGDAIAKIRARQAALNVQEGAAKEGEEE